ncbi:MAG TPA: class I SAM-dependent methyltransferase, partial [Pyrinomonadaceae bacterium]|nr:class I SAM-dependent methyltransferase [Pyrinomonadaceae bacterium]
MINFEESIAALDLSLFSGIESQSSPVDRSSFLACQLAVRSLVPGYRYLEIGSHLGGSIQPHLRDPLCSAIVSIDKRPQKQPDERGFDFTYLNNSTERMLENLRQVDEDAVAKITTIDGGTDEILPEQVGDPIHFCLIDGEHTDLAMKRDFDFCRRVLAPSGGAIMFHDAQITYNGIFDALEDLKNEGVRFNAYNLPHVVFMIE